MCAPSHVCDWGPQSCELVLQRLQSLGAKEQVLVVPHDKKRKEGPVHNVNRPCSHTCIGAPSAMIYRCSGVPMGMHVRLSALTDRFLNESHKTGTLTESLKVRHSERTSMACASATRPHSCARSGDTSW